MRRFFPALITLLMVMLVIVTFPIIPITRAQTDEARPFWMGFTPWPYAFTAEAQAETYDTIDQYADLVVHHMDTGIPWPEALAGEPYHPNVMDNIHMRLTNRQPDQAVYLAITPTSQTRNSLALYWGADEHMPLPPEWDGKTFDDPDVITAFLNHARFMIDQFEPDYFAYTIEITCGLRGGVDPAQETFERFAQVVYPALKADYPDLPIFLSVCSTTLEGASPDELIAATRRVLAYSDYVALSTYPYLFADELILQGDANPRQLPRDWFSRWANLAPEKPFAIAETGYIAEDLILPNLGIDIQGISDWQADYVYFLLRESGALDAEFVVWFVVRDYDAIVDLLAELGMETDAFLIWRDIGLFDAAGDPRPALERWDAWFAVPRQ